MKKKIYLTIFMLFAICMNTFAQATVSNFNAQMKIINKTYILPLLGGGLFLYAVISGILIIAKVKKGGDESTSAIINWLSSLIWPALVVVIAEGIMLVLSGFWGA